MTPQKTRVLKLDTDYMPWVVVYPFGKNSRGQTLWGRMRFSTWRAAQDYATLLAAGWRPSVVGQR